MSAKMIDTEDLATSGRLGGAASAAGLVLAGIAAGVAVGLLSAPDSGERTRARLRRTVRDGWGDLSDGLGRGVRTLRQEGNGALRRIENRLSELEDRIESARDAAIDAVEEPLARMRGRHRPNPWLGLLAGAAVSWFLTSERTADVRSEVREAARKARRRAADEWDRFQERGGFQHRAGSTVNGGTAGEPVQPV